MSHKDFKPKLTRPYRAIEVKKDLQTEKYDSLETNSNVHEKKDAIACLDPTIQWSDKGSTTAEQDSPDDWVSR